MEQILITDISQSRDYETLYGFDYTPITVGGELITELTITGEVDAEDLALTIYNWHNSKAE